MYADTSFLSPNTLLPKDKLDGKKNLVIGLFSEAGMQQMVRTYKHTALPLQYNRSKLSTNPYIAANKLSFSVEKRRDPQKLRNFWVPPLLNTKTQGGFTGEKKENHYITANAFSYIRTEFGALRSRRLAVNPVGD